MMHTMGLSLVRWLGGQVGQVTISGLAPGKSLQTSISGLLDLLNS